MSFLADPPAHDPDVERLYAADRARLGYVANYTRALAWRPAAVDAWAGLNGAVRSTMDPHRYELITLAAARRLGSAYCSLAHGKLLRERFHDAGTVARIAKDHHDAGLDPADAAVMDFAERVADDPNGITAADVDVLRGHGLSDPEILDVALAAAARCFFSTVIAAVGARPDPAYAATLDPALVAALTPNARTAA
ncbi:carboxymuconolactone decarboxylase family protein [Dactylosporangium sp. CS-047395]|uniref:carboxymuconolactone decarboxylase family protein n=1 Tax=Dactylosporangium sp. CS-047395 TaxID=3239936 RepID=UPI003D8DC7F2